MTTKMHLQIKPEEEYKDKIVKYYTDHSTFHQGDSGYDLFCLNDQLIPAGAYGIKVPLGFSAEAYVLKEYSLNYTHQMVKFPKSYYLYLRSSTGLKTPIRLANHVGVIDAGYRGQIMAIVDNSSSDAYTLHEGERYFQLCSPTLAPISAELVEELSSTTRDKGGFGSTGK